MMNRPNFMWLFTLKSNENIDQLVYTAQHINIVWQ